MNAKEFNRLLNGPLAHSLPMFRMTRLAMALQAVVDATGEAGAEALRAHCRERVEQDESHARLGRGDGNTERDGE